MASLLNQTLRLGVKTRSVCLSPNENQIAISTVPAPSLIDFPFVTRMCDLDSLELWPTGLCCATAAGHHCCCFSPDSKWLVVGGCSDLTSCHCVYDLQAFKDEHITLETKLTTQLPSCVSAIHLEPVLHNISVCGLTFTPDSKKLVSHMIQNYTREGLIRVWDLEGLEPDVATNDQFHCKHFTDFRPLKMVGNTPQQSATKQTSNRTNSILSSDGETLAYLYNGYIYIINMNNNTAYLLTDNNTNLTLSSTEFITFDFKPTFGGSNLITGSRGTGEIVFWKLGEAEAVISKVHLLYIDNFVVKVSPDGMLLAVCDCIGSTIILDYNTCHTIYKLEIPSVVPPNVSCQFPCIVLFTKDCRRCITCVSGLGLIWSCSLTYVAKLSHLCCIVLRKTLPYGNITKLPIPLRVKYYVKSLYL